MNTQRDVPAPLRHAAGQSLSVRLVRADRSALPDFHAHIIACGADRNRPPAIQWRLPVSSPPVTLELGELLEASFPLEDQDYAFDTLVLELARSHSHLTLWTSLPQELETVHRRRHRRVQPSQTVHLSVSLASGHHPLSALASVGSHVVHRGLLRNISVSGLNAVFPPDILAHVRVGLGISVSLRLPDDLEESLIDASIVYLRRRKKNTVSCGVEFHIPPTSPHVHKRIADFVLRERKNHAATDSILRFW